MLVAAEGMGLEDVTGPGGLFKRRHLPLRFRKRVLSSFDSDRRPTGLGLRPPLSRRLSGLLEGHVADAPEAHVLALAVFDRDAKHPTLGTARADEQIQAMAIGVAPRLRQGRHRPSRQSVVWVSS